MNQVKTLWTTTDPWTYRFEFDGVVWQRVQNEYGGRISFSPVTDCCRVPNNGSKTCGDCGNQATISGFTPSPSFSVHFYPNVPIGATGFGVLWGEGEYDGIVKEAEFLEYATNFNESATPPKEQRIAPKFRRRHLQPTGCSSHTIEFDGSPFKHTLTITPSGNFDWAAHDENKYVRLKSKTHREFSMTTQVQKGKATEHGVEWYDPWIAGLLSEYPDALGNGDTDELKNQVERYVTAEYKKIVVLLDRYEKVLA